uniref:Uncharacterized protein n=1 Tax=Oryza nivara TaxID=4536 RepID=A0A0E0G9Q1_ORYNI
MAKLLLWLAKCSQPLPTSGPTTTPSPILPLSLLSTHHWSIGAPSTSERGKREEPPPLPPPTSRAGSRSRRRHRRHRLPPRARGETSSPPPSSRFGWRLRPDSRAGVTSAALRTVAGLDLGPPRRCRPRPPPSAPSPAATAAVLRARGRRRREPPPPPLPASAQSTSMPASG